MSNLDSMKVTLIVDLLNDICCANPILQLFEGGSFIVQLGKIITFIIAVMHDNELSKSQDPDMIGDLDVGDGEDRQGHPVNLKDINDCYILKMTEGGNIKIV